MSSQILDDMRDVMRRRHYSIRTERSYCEWVKRFVLHFVSLEPLNPCLPSAGLTPCTLWDHTYSIGDNSLISP